MKIPKHVGKQLEDLKSQNRFRKLTEIEGIDFISNDYLGLTKEYPPIYSNFGSGGARLLSGNFKEHVALEDFISNWFNASALLFNSGYAANIGLLSALPSRHAIIFYDEEIHASCKDGLRLSLAKSISFKHNDLDHLKEKIKQFQAEERYILVESVYSMSGDKSPLLALAEICRAENIYLIVDEAHSFGIFGENGMGLAYEIQEVCAAIILPLGKAAGSFGALIISSEEIKQYLMNFSRAWIFSTSIPPIIAAHSLLNLKKLKDLNEERTQLFEYMKIFGIESPIFTIICPGNERVKQVSLNLLEKGFAQKPILSPTVPVGQERIRMVLHATHTMDEIKSLKTCLEEWSLLKFI